MQYGPPALLPLSRKPSEYKFAQLEMVEGLPLEGGFGGSSEGEMDSSENDREPGVWLRRMAR